MEGKKSFVLYCDLIHTVEKLPKEKAGELFLHILKYVNDLEPKTDDILIDAVFEGIKQQLKRDLQKYEEKRKQRSEAGKRSAEIRANKRLTKSTTVKSRSTNSTVNDNVNVNVTVNNIPSINEFVNYCLSKKSNLEKESIELKYESWKENGWKDGNDKPIKNWKSKALNIIPFLKEKENVFSGLSSKPLN